MPNRHCGNAFGTVNWQATSFAGKCLSASISSTLSALKEKWLLRWMVATIKIKSPSILPEPLGWNRKAFKCYDSGITKS